MTEPILYSFRRCPYAMRARLALLASGTRVQLREVVLKDKPAALLAASPKGTVPVMVTANGEVIDQSLNIMLRVLREYDPLHWLPATDDALERSLHLIARCDGEFKQHLDRYKYPHRFHLFDGLENRAQGAMFLIAINEVLSVQDFLHGPHWGMADAAIAPFIRQFAHTDAHWFSAQPWNALQGWLQAFEASDTFARCMHKAPAWKEGDAVTWFPEH
ncbi:glutathione S-transferase [Rhodoferax mekongensis]|uniref:Glutathione S-transferase n=1 Tax=Rhodoferax mekongensis TaxID=3068341 RepID=A0ABZ0AXF3_9BURK|nr:MULTISPECIES: glutathione S-transferase [unclassified Rhodoferax]MDT7515108.1 glutathione S-transferase [Rhodoferax sp. TBRC 17199]WNO04165.1 glutathione S-transferase [Rhodoferax sp. TBRC 17307]